MPRRIKLTLEYDGTDFFGWQTQDRPKEGKDARHSVRTVQGELERALNKLTGVSIRVVGAGRTDEGVHALGQVASFTLPDATGLITEQLTLALNAHLPADMSVTQAEDAPEDFNAMGSACGKLYRYLLFNRRQRSAVRLRTHWHVRFPLDTDAMHAAAQHFVGRHDFTALAVALAETQSKRVLAGKRALETVRTIVRAEVRACGSFDSAEGNEIAFEVEGEGFMYKMVRGMVGSLVEVGRGRQAPGWISEMLASKDRRNAGPSAPSKGLYLMRVMYGPKRRTTHLWVGNSF